MKSSGVNSGIYGVWCEGTCPITDPLCITFAIPAKCQFESNQGGGRFAECKDPFLKTPQRPLKHL